MRTIAARQLAGSARCWHSRLASGCAAAPAPVHATTAAKPFFITTPVYYVNSRPHLGHLYSSLLADATARYQRLAAGGSGGVLFSTGTDEHGQKVQEAAHAAGCEPAALCERVSAAFAALNRAFDVSSDDFVRTTEPRHAAVVRWLWRRLVARGAIRLGTHKGWYCRSDEAFLADSLVGSRAEYLQRRAGALRGGSEAAATAAATAAAAAAAAPTARAACDNDDGGRVGRSGAGCGGSSDPDPELVRALAALSPAEAAQRVSLESGHPVEWLHEPNYKFSLAAYRQPLLVWLEGGDASNGAAAAAGAAPAQPPVLPPFRALEVRALLESEQLADLSVSRLRDKVRWALAVPGDPAHSVYVWLDALASYLTVALEPRFLRAPPTVAALPLRAAEQQPQLQQPVLMGSSSPAPLGPEPLLELPDDVHWQALFPCWPADVHVVGKDILKFHAVYWPAFLLAAGLPLPRRIVAHGHWTVGRVKMSKSLGNVVDPMALVLAAPAPSMLEAVVAAAAVPAAAAVAAAAVPAAAAAAVPAAAAAAAPAAAAAAASTPAAVDVSALQALGLSVDALRYFLLHEGRVGADGDFSHDELVKRAVGECADGLGNLASRALSPKLMVGGVLPLPGAVLPPPFGPHHAAGVAVAGVGVPREAGGAAAAPSREPPRQLHFSPAEEALVQSLLTLRDVASACYDRVNPAGALEAVMDCVAEANRLFTVAKPWELAKELAAAPPLPPLAVAAAAQAAAAVSCEEGAPLAACARTRLASVLYLTLETLRLAGILLQPAMPTKSAVLLLRLGLAPASDARAWDAAVFGALPPAAYPALDVATACVLFAKPPPCPRPAAPPHRAPKRAAPQGSGKPPAL